MCRCCYCYRSLSYRGIASLKPGDRSSFNDGAAGFSPEALAHATTNK